MKPAGSGLKTLPMGLSWGINSYWAIGRWRQTRCSCFKLKGSLMGEKSILAVSADPDDVSSLLGEAWLAGSLRVGGYPWRFAPMAGKERMIRESSLTTAAYA